jgi:hypothetical protein
MRADRNVLGSLRDLVEDRILRVQTLARLLHIPDLDRVADDQRARIRLELPRQDLEERGLAGAVRTDDAEDGARRQVERDVAKQRATVDHLAMEQGVGCGVGRGRRQWGMRNEGGVRQIFQLFVCEIYAFRKKY